jgi:predicted DNA-binding transcriptional regulator AlpA
VPLVTGFQMVGVSRSTGYRLIAEDPSFPRPVECSPGRKGLIVAELEQWVAERAARGSSEAR